MTEQTVDSEVQHTEQVPEEAQVASEEPTSRTVRIRVGRHKRKLRIFGSTIQPKRESPSKKQTVDPEVEQTEQVPEEAQAASQGPAPRNLLRRFISRIPYTNEFGARIQEQNARVYEFRLNKYKYLRSIDSGLKDKLDPEFRQAAWQLSQTETWIEEAVSRTQSLVVAVFFVPYVIGPPVVANFFPNLFGWGIHGFWWWALELLLSVLTGILAFVIVFLPRIAFSSLERWIQDFFNVKVLVISWLAILLILTCGYLYSVNSGRLVAWPWPFSHRLSFYLLIQAGFFYPLFFAVALPAVLLKTTLQSRKLRFHARAVIIDQLLDILHDLEQSKDDIAWTKFWYRTWLTKRLEVVASCIESHFPRHFLTGAQETNRWVDRNTTEMANGVREMIKWIVAPNAHTYENFKARIIRYLTAALAGEWGEFDRVPAEKLSRKQSVKDRVTSAVTALLTAAVPVLLLLLLRRLGVVVAEPLLTYLTVGSYVWAALSLLSRVDPQYAAKLGALKDITSILPFGKGKAEK